MSTAEPLFFEDVEVGQEWMSEQRIVIGEDILAFAGLTGDRNPIHVDPTLASTMTFRRCVAHGLLRLSLGSGLNTLALPLRTLAIVSLKEWQFRSPVYPGDTIHIRSRALEKTARPHGRRGTITLRCQILNQDGTVVQEGVTVLLVEGHRAASPRRRACSRRGESDCLVP